MKRTAAADDGDSNADDGEMRGSAGGAASKRARAQASPALPPPTVPPKLSGIQKRVAEASHKVFAALGYGLTEHVYHEALMIELRETHGLTTIDREVPLPVPYRNRYAGYVRADVLLECSHGTVGRGAVSPGPLATRSSVIVELKSLGAGLNEANVHQLRAYMRLLRVRRGVLVNFDQRNAPLRAAMRSGDGAGGTVRVLDADAIERNAPPTPQIIHLVARAAAVK